MSRSQTWIGEPSSASWSLLLEHGHRVANEYALATAMLSLAARRSQSPEARDALTAAADKLRLYSDAYRTLQPPLQDDAIYLADYLRPMCAAIAKANLADRDIQLVFVEDSVLLDAGRCLRVGAIVSELITNVVKHRTRSTSGEIVVELTARSGQVFCSVVDEAACPQAGPTGHGSRILAVLAAELGGALEQRFGPDGAISLLSFPQAPPSDSRAGATSADSPTSLS